MSIINRENIFEFNDYKVFLRSLAGPRSQRRGIKAKISRALNVQPGYIAQVLYGNADLSIEKAELITRFLGMTPEETYYFILMVSKERAGTSELKNFFENQIHAIRKKQLDLTHRLGRKGNLSKNDQRIYYSSWHYAAVHMLLILPNMDNSLSISEFLSIPRRRAVRVLDFLCKAGLAKIQNGKFVQAKAGLRLSRESPEIISHHAHWRQMAVHSLERETDAELHYSSVIVLSESLVVKIKKNLLRLIEDNLKTIEESKNEKLYCLNMDFFDLDAKTQN